MPDTRMRPAPVTAALVAAHLRGHNMVAALESSYDFLCARCGRTLTVRRGVASGDAFLQLCPLYEED